jgi:hypothetical protein
MSGLGVDLILKRLNAAKVPTWGKAKEWGRAYTLRLLRSRRLLGEYQRLDKVTGHGFGSVIKNYYPAVVSEADFDRVQRAVDDRLHQRGPRGKMVTSLFTRLMFSASDGSPMHLTAKGVGQKHLVSSAAARGRVGAVYLGFPYQAVEDAFLAFLREVRPEDICPLSAEPEDDGLDEAEAELARLELRVAEVQQEIRKGGEFEALVSLLRDLDSDRQKAARRVEEIRSSRHQSPAEQLLAEGKSVVSMMKKAKGDELLELRFRLRSAIKSLVSTIWCRVFRAKFNGEPWKVAVMEVHFLTGVVRHIFILSHKSKTHYKKLDFSAGFKSRLDVRKEMLSTLVSMVVGKLERRFLDEDELKKLRKTQRQ